MVAITYKEERKWKTRLRKGNKKKKAVDFFDACQFSVLFPRGGNLPKNLCCESPLSRGLSYSVSRLSRMRFTVRLSVPV
jgi:hypothetical protein